MATKKRKKTLSELLDVYAVGEVDDDHIIANGDKLEGIRGWFWVANDDGVFAYFGKELDAFRFRLAEVNRCLNG